MFNLVVVAVAARAAASHLELRSYPAPGGRLLAAVVEVPSGATEGAVDFNVDQSTVPANLAPQSITVGGITYSGAAPSTDESPVIRFADLRTAASPHVTLCGTTVTRGNPHREHEFTQIDTAVCSRLSACVFTGGSAQYTVSATAVAHTLGVPELRLGGSVVATVDTASATNANVVALSLLGDVCLSSDGTRHTLYVEDTFSTNTALFSMLLMLAGVVLWSTPSIELINGRIKVPRSVLRTVGGAHGRKHHIVLADFASTALSIVAIRAAAVHPDHNIYRSGGGKFDANNVVVTIDVVVSALVCIVNVVRCRNALTPEEKNLKGEPAAPQGNCAARAFQFMCTLCGSGRDTDGIVARSTYEHVVVVTFMACMPRSLGLQFYHCTTVGAGVVMSYVAGRDLYLASAMDTGSARWRLAGRCLLCTLNVYALCVMCLMPLIARSRAFSDEDHITVSVAVGTAVTLVASGVYNATALWGPTTTNVGSTGQQSRSLNADKAPGWVVDSSGHVFNTISHTWMSERGGAHFLQHLDEATALSIPAENTNSVPSHL